MPAVHPQRLKRDISALMEQLDTPDEFERGLEGLFEFYADRTIRPARSGAPASLLPAYHLPKPVLRAVEHGLAGLPGRAPTAALALADRLWGRSRLEFKSLAVRLLEYLPPEESDQAMERITAWCRMTEDAGLLSDLFRVGTLQDLTGTVRLLEALLSGREPQRVRTALAALSALAEHAAEEALPGIFRIYGQLLHEDAIVKQPGTMALTRTLARRSPAELAFFLRQRYLVSMQPEIGRLLRHALPAMPEHIRDDLREMLRENRKR